MWIKGIKEIPTRYEGVNRMKTDRCWICHKEMQEDIISKECPECYSKGARFEKEKAIEEFADKIKKPLLKECLSWDIPKEERFEMYEIIDKIKKQMLEKK